MRAKPDSFANLTLQNLYNISEPKLAELCSKYDITKFVLPKISGYNSLVFYADSKNHKFAIKIYVSHKKNLGMIDTINKHVSENLISPKIIIGMTCIFPNDGFVLNVLSIFHKQILEQHSCGMVK